ncbi:MAG: coproporphyrinogen III oxidase, partial [Alphaproteobacteria bacterium]|nr:coproporphyrinogen III oxidase [Alphaproteobacteria bacterium]
AREALLMGLRLGEGVDLARIAALSGVGLGHLVDERAIDQLTDLGLIRLTGTRLQVAPAGMLLLDAILPEVVAV